MGGRFEPNGRIVTNNYIFIIILFLMHTNLVRVIIWTNKVLNTRGALVMCILTTLALDRRLSMSALRKCAPQTMHCHSSSLLILLCILNIIVLLILVS